jgi:beta-N-acetylhexosaminidase
MKRMLITVAVLLLMVTVCACSKASMKSTDPGKAKAEKTLSQRTLEAMSLDEKIGQLFIIRPEALDPDYSFAQINDMNYYGKTSLNKKMTDAIKKYPVGGIILFSKDIKTPDQLQKYTAALQKSSSIPLFMGIDEEGGSISRIAADPDFKVKHYKSMTAVGNTGDTDNAYDVGTTIGTYLENYGFNLDFAPDADVNTNPDNIVIGDRAFGSDPELVADMVAAEIKGFHNVGVMTCAKHFPGHGDTIGDTHKGYVAITKTWDQLETCELLPFKSAIDADTDMIMVAHITAKNISDDGLPASLSKEMITDHLRGDLGYRGVVITDSMSMGAVINSYTSGNAAVKAFNAGADIILMPADYRAAFDSIKDAVNNGTISEKRLDQSVLRILELKDKYGLLKETDDTTE